MKKLNRRSFIGKTTIGLGAVLGISQWPESVMATGLKYKQPIGFQVWPLREEFAKDIPGTMKKMANMGYQEVELCYPAGYGKGFASWVSMKPADMRKMIKDVGLHCESCHIPMSDLRGSSLDKSLEFARELKLKQIICPSFGVPGTSISQFKEAANELNKMAEKIKSAGFKTGFHNHAKEFETLDGELIYDAIMGELDGNLVKMQFQTEVINTGYKGPDYFKKYPGRFISAHLSDWSTEKKQVPIGRGIIDWKEFFEAAETGGIKNFFVEMSPETLKDSATYIHGLLG